MDQNKEQEDSENEGLVVMSSLYEMELENIKERTTNGRQIYVLKGGKLGKPKVLS